MYKWVIIYLSFSIVFTAGAFGKGEKQAAVDFYYSAPFNLAAGQSSVASRLGIYDSTWSSLQVDSTGAAKIETGRDTLWLAAHCLAIAPGNYLFALSLGLPGLRAVDHGKIKLDPYRGTILEMIAALCFCCLTRVGFIIKK